MWNCGKRYGAWCRRLPSGRRGLKYGRDVTVLSGGQSPPFGEAWIEMSLRRFRCLRTSRRLPSGRRGLKYDSYEAGYRAGMVASLRGGVD